MANLAGLGGFLQGLTGGIQQSIENRFKMQRLGQQEEQLEIQRKEAEARFKQLEALTEQVKTQGIRHQQEMQMDRLQMMLQALPMMDLSPEENRKFLENLDALARASGASDATKQSGGGAPVTPFSGITGAPAGPPSPEERDKAIQKAKDFGFPVDDKGTIRTSGPTARIEMMNTIKNARWLTDREKAMLRVEDIEEKMQSEAMRVQTEFSRSADEMNRKADGDFVLDVFPSAEEGGEPSIGLIGMMPIEASTLKRAGDTLSRMLEGPGDEQARATILNNYVLPGLVSRGGQLVDEGVAWQDESGYFVLDPTMMEEADANAFVNTFERIKNASLTDVSRSIGGYRMPTPDELFDKVKERLYEMEKFGKKSRQQPSYSPMIGAGAGRTPPPAPLPTDMKRRVYRALTDFDTEGYLDESMRQEIAGLLFSKEVKNGYLSAATPQEYQALRRDWAVLEQIFR